MRNYPRMYTGTLQVIKELMELIEALKGPRHYSGISPMGFLRKRRLQGYKRDVGFQRGPE